MSEPAEPAISRPMRIVLGVFLVVSLLDLTTSLIDSPADHLFPIAEKPGWLIGLQCALVIPLIAMITRHKNGIADAWRALPIPRAARLVLGLWLAIALAHVALRAERYPFSPVTMFSSGVPEPTDELMRMRGYAVMSPDGVEVISWLREGNPLFARHAFGYDYKAGWAMHMYAVSHSSARDVVEEQLRAEGAEAPLRVDFEYARGDGRLRLPEGQQELP